MLIIELGKNEIVFVCNKGNLCIRFIKGVYFFNVNYFVGILKLYFFLFLCNNWKFEGLVVVGSLIIVVIEGNGFYLVYMDDIFIVG